MSTTPLILTRSKLWFWLAAGLGFFVFLYLIKGILLPFVVGILTAYFLDPAADKLEEWGFSRTLAAVTIIIGFFSIVILVIVLLSPVIVEQLTGLIQALPGYLIELREKSAPYLHRFLNVLDPVNAQQQQEVTSAISTNAIGLVSGFMQGVLMSGLALVNILSLLFITPVVAFYLLRDWDHIVARVDELLPKPTAPVIREQARNIDAVIAGFLRGQTNVCLFLATFYTIGLTLVGLNFAVLIGIITGFLAFIPYVGVIVGASVAIAIAFFQFDDYTYITATALVFIIGQFIEGNFVTPKLMGEKVGLHPVWIIFGMLSGAALFGFVGILIAVPVTAIIGVLVRFAIQRYRDSAIYQGDTPNVIVQPHHP